MVVKVVPTMEEMEAHPLEAMEEAVTVVMVALAMVAAVVAAVPAMAVTVPLRVAAVSVVPPTVVAAGIHPVATRAWVVPVVLAVIRIARTQAHSISQTQHRDIEPSRFFTKYLNLFLAIWARVPCV